MALVMAFFLLWVGCGSGRFGFPAKKVGSVMCCGLLGLCVYGYKNDFSLINGSMGGFWYGFGLVLELCCVVWMCVYWRNRFVFCMVK